ncbi:MAG: baseplate J/gp47 family protein, partial [Aquificota bacterium]|nr:baseplate J/gp47 family protein [Aquificota bacterium]
MIQFLTVTKVENTTMSMYGTDTEDDERFRERIRLSIERFTNAGSKSAYIYHTKTAHQDIEDVSVFSPQAGQVKVVFLLKDGQLPDAQMIRLVENHLSDEKVRPLTDQVIVSAPQVVNYNISLTYYISRKDSALVSQIQQRVNQAVQDFINWTKTKIGRDVLPEELISRVKSAGAYRVSLTAPTYTQIAQDQVAHAQSVNIT